MPGRRFGIAAAAAVVALLAQAPSGASAASPLVVKATLEGEINAATSTYIAQAVQRAESEHAQALLVVMNTPGGLSTSMDDMVTSLLNSRVPVVVYVAPVGARADSAGLFVAQAADVVAMAPGTNVGSAHPINAGGGNIGGELEKKVVNDAVARIRNLASIHDRNPDWCEKAVRQSDNVGVDQAVDLHVVDLKANDVPSLLSKIDGRELPRARATLHVSGARLEDDPMPVPLQLLQLLINPNVAYLLLLLAIFGLIAEVTTPGAILPGTVGAISAILALVAFTSLPVNIAGVLLILFAFVLFVIDLKAPTHGVLTIGGVISLVLGSAFLINTGAVGEGINLWLIAGAALASAGFFGFVLSKAVKARSRPAYDLTVASPPPNDKEGVR
ncbi:MAG TPA: nodulation protein NfeD [Candidatus Dormibacteraeota bacterium]|nr:nodulation protein NfeD [Candidatus Dormibacteraeota bacterium]